MVARALAPRTLDAFIAEVRTRTGVHLDSGKATMLSSRLRRRVRALGLETFEDYLKHLRTVPDEEPEFIHVVTTHKTDMFRTRRVWKYLWEEYLPSAGSRVRAWSAACSSGEEPASLGALFQAHAARSPGFRYQVLATDISAPVVAQAKEARFALRDVPEGPGPFGVPIRPFFDRDGDGLRLQQRIRAASQYRTHNLFDRMSAPPFDLVLVRNVIIYFTEEDKKRVIRNAVRALARDGLLVIGESESLIDVAPELENVGHCLYRRAS